MTGDKIRKYFISEILNMSKDITFLEYKNEWTFYKNNNKTPRDVCDIIKK